MSQQARLWLQTKKSDLFVSSDLQRRLRSALERPHRLGMLGGDLDEHVRHGLAFAQILDQLEITEGRGADLGTGGGVPGVILAAVVPKVDWSLIEIRTSRAAEVERSILTLGANATVETRPAQELAHDDGFRGQYQVVVARAFGPPSVAAECGAGLLELGGVLVVSEPPDGDPERWPAKSMAKLGFGEITKMTGDGVGFAVARTVASTNPDLPRLPPRHDRGWR